MSGYKLIRPNHRTAARLATASRVKLECRSREVGEPERAKTENNG